MTLEHDPGTESGETDALVERLVRAGRTDGPSAKALAAAPAAVATLLSGQAAAAAGLTPALGAVASAGKVAASPFVLLTWIAVSAGVTAAALAVGSAFRETPLAAPSAVVLNVSAPRSGLATPSSAAATPPAVVEPPRAAESTPSAAVAPASPAVASAPRGDLSREVALLDAARQALVDGSPSRALGILGTLERMPRRALAPEATVLRVRALLAEGTHTEARRVAEAYCNAAPSSPQASVLRALIADSEIRAAPSRL
jgi:hypothetical protein